MLRDALATGTVTLEQATVIRAAVAALPAEADPDAVHAVAHLLVGWASRFEPTVLRGMGARILHHVAPDLAEDADRRAVERDADRAHQCRHLTWSIRSGGHMHLKGVLDAEAGAALTAAIGPLAGPAGVDDTRSPGQPPHDALTDVCHLALRTGELPESGDDATQVVITTNYDTITRQLGTGTLDTGQRITPEQVRRLACDAGILPAVLGGSSQVLDLGRARRLITGAPAEPSSSATAAARSPAVIGRPATATGATSSTGQMVAPPVSPTLSCCAGTTTDVHHTGWQIRLAPDGLPEFIPPAWLDPAQIPRRNHYHHRRPPGTGPPPPRPDRVVGVGEAAPAGPDPPRRTTDVGGRRRDR